MVTIFSTDWTIYNYTLKNRNSRIITQTIISHLKQLNTKKTVTYVVYIKVLASDRHVYTTPYTQSIYMYIPPIYTINIHVYTTLIHNQYRCTYYSYIQSIYMYIWHPYTQSIYMYIPPLYRFNIQNWSQFCTTWLRLFRMNRTFNFDQSL